MATLFFLHALGASARSFDAVIARLEGMACVALDLPGFGDRSGEAYRDVAGMADDVARTIAARGAERCILVGHSMGGKIATVLAARRTLPVAGVVLVAGSPPSPEPIEDARRSDMLGWLDGATIARPHAEAFVDANCATPLPDAVRERAVADVCRSNPAAWRGWLDAGADEDWAARVGTIDLPATIVAGGGDGDLGEAAQRRLNLPHYPRGTVEVVAGAAHLIPYEKPGALAAVLREAIRTLPGSAPR
ncbi:alpha/beta fold hydrolase [Sphingomonas sp. Leaf25]|uniref:alpha/beta fold hydrolase n=1 Tax=Sphingomonas sp. Leaf25 TaxID=1735692 RepID=UPI0006F27010|nr:alpha/beta hydrolase [Sphingomonas sp. Leaf25]KQN00487.1 hypothetical protein ASE78_05155 [Sphingomonas sp. Leaf25]